MATREENLKKINEELEKLSDEQLEQIAGGDELVFDSVADRYYARFKVGDVKKEPELNIENQNRIIHVR